MSGADYAEKEIDGLRVMSSKLDVWAGSMLLGRMISVAGPAFIHLAMAIATGARLQDLNVDELAPQVGEAFSKLDRETHDFIVLSTLASTEIVRDTQKFSLLSSDKIKAAFTGKSVWTLWKTLLFVWELNFKGFSPGGSPTPSATANEA